MAAQTIQQIDVDELAKEKVQEVETLLESSDNIKLDAINSWLSILKQIITAADLHRTNDKNGNTESIKVDESIYADYVDDYERFNSVDLTEQFATNSVKWTIRVKAFKLVHRLVQMNSTSKSLLLRHLPDLIRLSFVAATSPYDDLKTQGFEMFKYLINRFASVEEKEFPGHSILEQYRTQVLSALKPAFNLDAPPYITAIASQVCCLWIIRGLERDLANLRRTYQLMIMTIDKLENQSINQNSKLYTESELEQERLDILGSWAHLYITAKESVHAASQEPCINSNLLNLVKPQVGSLIEKWWEALKDYALLIMPAPRIISASHDNEHVYTREVALRLFAPIWYKLILASATWLCSDDISDLPSKTNHSTPDQNQIPSATDNANENKTCDITKSTPSKTNNPKYIKFICGILMKELCSCHSEDLSQKDSLAESTIYAIRSLFFLVSTQKMQSVFSKDLAITQEFYTILYSIFINSRKLKSQHHMLLKNLLELIFNLVARRVIENPTNMKYAIVYYADKIDQKFSDLERSIDSEEKMASETLKLNLSIMTSRIICILKLAPDVIEAEPDIQLVLLNVFRKSTCFKIDLSISMSFLEQSKDLHNHLPLELNQIFMLDLLKAQVIMVTYLLSSINCEEFKDKKTHSILFLETYLKYSRSIINVSTEHNRKVLMTTYLDTVLKTLSKSIEAKSCDQGNISMAQNIPARLVIKHINDLIKDYPKESDEIMDPKMKDILTTANERLKNIKAGDDKRRNIKIESDKLTVSGMKTGPSKPAAKITLRADFSNFYAKKS